MFGGRRVRWAESDVWTSWDVTPSLWASACPSKKGEGEARKPLHFPPALTPCDLQRSEKQEGRPQLQSTGRGESCVEQTQGRKEAERATHTQPRRRQTLNCGVCSAPATSSEGCEGLCPLAMASQPPPGGTRVPGGAQGGGP